VDWTGSLRGHVSRDCSATTCPLQGFVGGERRVIARIASSRRRGVVTLTLP